MPNNDKPAGKVLYIQALTSLHPGSGTALGSVDLPVQRERHTKWPLIPGSTIKGVLRDAAKTDHELLYGSEGTGGELFAGALTFTDARILAFPVRSLKGVFAWATCPMALERWKRDLALAGQEILVPGDLNVGEGQGIAAKSCPCVQNGEIYLEEFKFKVIEKPTIPASFLPPGCDGSRVVVLNDTDFTYFTEHATEISARIRLSKETKTVEEGALFYQEFVPPESIFYSVVLASTSRDPGNGRLEADKVLEKFVYPKHVQIGGDETTGKGLCRLYEKYVGEGKQ